jgi:erythromycin esterase-like protein
VRALHIVWLSLIACDEPIAIVDAGASDAGTDAGEASACPGEAPTLDEIVPLPVPVVDGEEDHEGWDCALRAIDPIVPPRAIVCSAEDAHGVRESGVVHAELARHLVRTARLRALAWEASDASLDTIEEYFRTGDESLIEPYLDALRGAIGATNEARDLFVALRGVQEELLGGETFAVHGIDVAVRVDTTRARLLSFLEVADPDEATSIEGGAPTESQIGSIAQLEQASALLAAVVDDWESRRARYEAATNAARTDRARSDAENLRDGYGFLSHYLAGDFQSGSREYREPGMERNLVDLAERAEGPLLLIAHAGHCSRTSSIGGVPVLGARIDAREDLSARYRVIAQTYASGEQLQLSSSRLEVVPISRSSLAPALAAISEEDAFLVSASSDRFDSSGIYGGEYGSVYEPAISFDAIVFLRNVTASRVWE